MEYQGVKNYSAIGLGLNEMYTLSFHMTFESAKKGKFGNDIVVINNPERFAEDITSVMQSLQSSGKGNFYGGVSKRKVKYTKNDQIQYKPNGVELAILAECQKSKKYKSEKEFRFVIILDKRNKKLLYEEKFLVKEKNEDGKEKEYLIIPIVTVVDYFQYIN